MNKLSFLDQVLKLSDGGVRSLDCVLAAELNYPISDEELAAGNCLAQKTYPKTAQFNIPLSRESSLEDFLNKPLASEWHLENARIGNLLCLKLSHILGDGVSLLLFARASFQGDVSSPELELHTFPPKKDSPYRYKKVSEVWPPCPRPTGKRGYETFSLHHPEAFGKYGLNDILSLAVLRALPVVRKSLWVPVNVRKSRLAGFGNGLSRMRLYPLQNASSTSDALQYLGKQKREAWKNGEIFLPKKEFPLNLVMKVFLKLWLARPWADWGTISFSHIQSHTPILSGVERLIGITNVPKNLTAAIFAYTAPGRTDITITFDTGVNRALIKNFGESIQKQFADIQADL